MTLVYNPSAGDERHEGEHLLERVEEAGHDVRLVSGRKKLARQLEAAIESGVLTPGNRLGNEIELSVRLGLSRPTVRQAIRSLVDKGLLVRSRGVGPR